MLDSLYLDFFYIFLGIFILVYLAVFEYLSCFSCNANDSQGSQTLGSYGYGIQDGPHTWRKNFPYAAGECQSPVNLIYECAIVIHVETLRHPLEFSREYRLPPNEMCVMNDGHTINLYVEYGENPLPKICGGPLDGTYELYSLSFRWGAHDEEGTEHMIDNKRYAMEMQLTYVRPGHRNMYIAAEAGDVIMLAYMFQVTPVDNPYLDVLLSHIGPKTTPFQTNKAESIPISLLAPCFSRGYFSYVGSLTHPPCTEGIRWIVQPEPLSISSNQMKQFRRTPMLYCSLNHNTRPVQDLNSREIIYYD